jgi:hypothetical protein
VFHEDIGKVGTHDSGIYRILSTRDRRKKTASSSILQEAASENNIIARLGSRLWFLCEFSDNTLLLFRAIDPEKRPVGRKRIFCGG